MKRFIDVLVPVTTCNLKCHYCYVTISGSRELQPTPMKYTPEQIGRALTQERLGGVCHMNICGAGETLILPELIEIVRQILAHGHYVMIVTNGTLSRKFDDFIALPQECHKRLGFKFSYHYLELKERGLFPTFYENVNKVKAAGMSYSIELMPCDELAPRIEDIKKDCMEQFGALCHVTVPRDVSKSGFTLQSTHTLEEVKETWGSFGSAMFDFKMSVWEAPRKEFCYAGAWSGLLDLGTGEMTACYGSKIRQNIIDAPTRPIDFTAVGRGCCLEHCFNAHSLLALGNIPEIRGTHYNEERNRVDCRDGSTWLTPEMNEFLNHRLEDYNPEFSTWKKLANCVKARGYNAKTATSEFVRTLTDTTLSLCGCKRETGHHGE